MLPSKKLEPYKQMGCGSFPFAIGVSNQHNKALLLFFRLAKLFHATLSGGTC